MRKIVLDAEQIDSRETLFACVKEQMGSEVFVGNNLDAFYDALTECAEPVELEVGDAGLLREKLGSYFDRFLRVYQEYRQEKEL